jgi:hypothetical protein
MLCTMISWLYQNLAVVSELWFLPDDIFFLATKIHFLATTDSRANRLWILLPQILIWILLPQILGQQDPMNSGKYPQMRSTWISSRNMSCARETHFRRARVVLPAGQLLFKGSLRWSHIIDEWVGLERMADVRTSNVMCIGKGCLLPMGNG